MAHPTGESVSAAPRLNFDRRLKLELHGSSVPSDAGLLPFRELDDVLGLMVIAGQNLADGRTGRNGRHDLIGMLRQSVFGRLAGDEDVNDADRLGRDPAMRWIVGGRAATKQAASTSQMGRFETDWLANDENLVALADLGGRWIDRVRSRRPVNGIVLDIVECERDLWRPGRHSLQRSLRLHLLSSAVRVQSVWRAGTLRIAFRQRPFGPRLEGRAGAGRGPVSGQVQAPLLSRRCRLREPGGLRVPGGGSLQLRDPAACQSGSSTEDRLLAQAPCWSSSERGPPDLRQLPLSSAKLEDTTPRGDQGRVAPWRTLSSRWFHRHQPVATRRAGRCLLQQARDVRAVDQGRQERHQVDAAVMLLVRRQRRAASVSCAGLQSRQLHADAGYAGGDQAVVADQPAGKTHQNWSQGRAPWTLRHIPNGRGRGDEGTVP